MQIRIEPVASHLQHIGLLTGWLHDEWDGNRDEIARLMRSSDDRPGAIIAFANSQPVGVLSFRTYRADWQANAALWINAVWVLPQFRRRGIAHQLVSFATESTSVTMFVYTDIPVLYRSCGWRFKREGDDKYHQTLVYLVNRFTKPA